MMKQKKFSALLVSSALGLLPSGFAVLTALAQGNAAPPANGMTNAFSTNAASNSSPAEGSTDGATELISLEYRNAPLVEVIRALADSANLNIALSSEVEKGSPVTIRLNRVTYEQALKTILETYKFGSVYDNGILKIDTISNLNAIREEKLREKESAWRILPTKRLVWQVNYAKAVELQPILDVMLKGYKIDPRFSIVSDKRTNKLIIEGISDALVEAKAILENLDRRKQQVLIEARIVEASSELSKTLSVTWGTRFGLDGNRGLANGLVFPNSLTGSVGGAGALGSSAPNPGLATSPTQLGTLQFTVGSINNLINIDAVLRAYETEALANVIASPRVVVQDQEKAIIKEDVTLSRSVLGPDGKPEGRSTVAALELQVSPQVTSENTLELDIQVQRQTPTNAPSDPVQGAIKRQANTKLIVANGETAVIGGLYQTQKFKGQGRVPFLGSLPIIGGLFRTNAEQSFRSELMVLITPRILPGGQGRPASARADLPISGSSSGSVRNNGGVSNNFGNANGGNFSNGGGSNTAAANNAAGGANGGANVSNNGGNSNFNSGSAGENGNGNVGGNIGGNAGENGGGNFGENGGGNIGGNLNNAANSNGAPNNGGNMANAGMNSNSNAGGNGQNPAGNNANLGTENSLENSGNSGGGNESGGNNFEGGEF